MRRLTHVRPARLNPVVGTDRDVDFLFRIAVVVPDEERVRAVGILEPPFVRAGHAGAEAARRLAGAGESE